jgi:hypothetical protein
MFAYHRSFNRVYGYTEFENTYGRSFRLAKEQLKKETENVKTLRDLAAPNLKELTDIEDQLRLIDYGIDTIHKEYLKLKANSKLAKEAAKEQLAIEEKKGAVLERKEFKASQKSSSAEKLPELLEELNNLSTAITTAFIKLNECYNICLSLQPKKNGFSVSDTKKFANLKESKLALDKILIEFITKIKDVLLDSLIADAGITTEGSQTDSSFKTIIRILKNFLNIIKETTPGLIIKESKPAGVKNAPITAEYFTDIQNNNLVSELDAITLETMTLFLEHLDRYLLLEFQNQKIYSEFLLVYKLNQNLLVKSK